MAILDKNAFFEAINARVGDSTADEDLQFLADMQDTYNSLAVDPNTTVSRTDYDTLQGRYNELAANYRERFLNGDSRNKDNEPEQENESELRAKSVKFGDLFTQRNKQ